MGGGGEKSMAIITHYTCLSQSSSIFISSADDNKVNIDTHICGMWSGSEGVIIQQFHVLHIFKKNVYILSGINFVHTKKRAA